MPQLALAAGGALIGGAIAPGIVGLGLTGAGIGWGLGSLAGALLFRPDTPRPQMGDLTAPRLTYGSPIPRVWGTVLVSGSLAWCSEARAVEETAGGKGGGDQVVGYRYYRDMMFTVAVDSDVIAIRRVQKNGKWVWSADSTATAETLQASKESSGFDDIELLDGNPAQLPHPIYEAAVGTADASAYRYSTNIFLTNVDCGSSPTPPVFLFEVCTAGTAGAGNWPHTYTFTGRGYSSGSADFDQYEADNYLRPAGDWRFDIVQMSGTFNNNTGDHEIGRYYTRNDNIGGAIAYYCDVSVSTNLSGVRLLVQIEGTAAYSAYLGFNLFSNTISVRYTVADNTVRVYLGELLSITMVGVGAGGGLDASYTRSFVEIGNINSAGADFSVVRADLTLNNGTADIIAPLPVDLADVVSDICEWAGIPAAQFDVTALAGTDVRGFAAVSGPRQSLEQLAAVFGFGCVAYDKLYFVLRGGSSAAMIAYADMGAGVDQAAEEALELTRGNDGEIARIAELTYPNWNADHESGSVRGDRGTGDQSSNSSATVAVVMTPAEAQRVADIWALDGRASGTSFKVAVTDDHARVGPTDVVVLTDRDATTYRARVVAEDFAAGVKSWEMVLDDASIFSQPGVASDYTTPTVQIPLQAESVLHLIDAPIFRDADDSPGIYACVTADGAWTAATVVKSQDGINYVEVGTVVNRGIVGVTSGALGSHTGWGWDTANTLTVTLDAGSGGTLSSSTKSAIEADETVNVAVIGAHGRWEVVRFANAVLVSGSTHLLSDFLRGQQGTEHNIGNHQAGDKLILIRATGMLRIPGTVADLGQTRYYKALNPGQTVTAATEVTLVSGEQGLTPYAAVNLRSEPDADGNATLIWNRRTRLSSTFLSATQPPLGEASESYDVELYSGSTLIASDTVSEASWSVPALTQEVQLTNATRSLLSVGGDIVGILDPQPSVQLAQRYFVRHDSAGVWVSPYSDAIGHEALQWVANGDNLIVVSSTLNAGPPITYASSKVQRFVRTSLGAAAATLTAGTAGDYQGVAFDGTDVWISERQSGNLRKLNASTLASVAAYAVSDPGPLAFASGDLFTVCLTAGQLVRWDIGTTAELYRVSCVTNPYDILIVGSLAFVLSYGQLGVYNISDGSLVTTHAVIAPVTRPQQAMIEHGAYVAVADGLAGLRVLLLDKTTGLRVGSIAAPFSKFYGVAGSIGGLLYLIGEPFSSGSTSVQTRGFDISALSLSGLTARVYQLSESIGRGNVAEVTL